MTNTLIKYKPKLMVEISSDVTKSSDDRMKVFTLLQQHNYESHVIKKNGELIRPNDLHLNDYTNFVFICKNES